MKTIEKTVWVVIKDDEDFDIDTCCGENEMYAWGNYKYNYGGTQEYNESQGYRCRKAKLTINID